jgi:hypothetical protein
MGEGLDAYVVMVVLGSVRVWAMLRTRIRSALLMRPDDQGRLLNV